MTRRFLGRWLLASSAAFFIVAIVFPVSVSADSLDAAVGVFDSSDVDAPSAKEVQAFLDHYKRELLVATEVVNQLRGPETYQQLADACTVLRDIASHLRMVAVSLGIAANMLVLSGHHDAALTALELAIEFILLSIVVDNIADLVCD